MPSPIHARPDNKKIVETGDRFTPKFDADGLIPAIATDHASGQVLMFAFMNQQALELTLQTGQVHYYSRSRGKLWLKGESSGHVQLVKEIRTDCDQDVIWVRVDTQGAASCHVGYASCFYLSAPLPPPKR